MSLTSPPFFISRGDNWCPYCEEYSIELYNDRNIPMKYSQLLQLYGDRAIEMTMTFDRTVLDHFECSNCRRQFRIDWRKGYPIPFFSY
jgi:hypothetical protein